MTTTTTASGVRIAYELTGDPTGDPLLLINGTGAQLIGWRSSFRNRLADLGYAVYAVDNRDVGESQRFPGTSYTLSDMAKDCVDFLESLGIEGAHIVGQSMGGMIAQEIAIDHQPMVLSLALLYTSPEFGTYNTGAAFRKRRDSLPTPRTRDEAIENMVINEQACASTAFQQDVEWIREVGGKAYDRGLDAEGVARQRTAISSSRSRTNLLQTITAPTLVIHGKSDNLLDYHGSMVISEQIPESDLYLVAGLGHEVHSDLEEHFVRLIHRNGLRAHHAKRGNR
ncbi:alpha/beta fold hydrolase [Paenarthrobacter sp. NPDC089675]|uniref:alpha/beta fold hydrolase n=1 Tax=Paenarthrobacter sp. NPDC089675 TaxID=3364376 RepID=UPI0038269A5B